MINLEEIFQLYGVPDVGIVEHNKRLYSFVVEQLLLVCLFVNDGHIQLGFMTDENQCLIFLVGEDPHAQWSLCDEYTFFMEIWNALKRGELSMLGEEEDAIRFIFNYGFAKPLD